jgi:hypothetical protein
MSVCGSRKVGQGLVDDVHCGGQNVHAVYVVKRD